MKTPGKEELSSLIDWSERLLGHPIPQWVKDAIAIAIIAFVFTSLLCGTIFSIAKIKSTLIPNIIPTDKITKINEDIRLRREFIRHIIREIERRNKAESWQDRDFTDLGAEVEVERSRAWGILWRNGTQIRREKSLTNALRRSRERLILVEGDPGSGKSVSLRHLALLIGAKSEKSRSVKAICPIFVNLKEIKQEDGDVIDAAFIKKFILSQIKRVSDRFIDAYIESTFEEKVRRGEWIFIFDSFDEIPEVLSSTEFDKAIERYAQAIDDFMSASNKCRAIISSRFYRGPQNITWQKVRILPLSGPRQVALVNRALPFARDAAALTIDRLSKAPEDIRIAASNPMLLALLSDHVATTGRFPASALEIFESFLEGRFESDAHRVELRFGISSLKLREMSEKIAFIMMSNASLGLSPTRKSLIEIVNKGKLFSRREKLEKYLDALEYMKVARVDNDQEGDLREFTFSHRRFQEYFATKVVLRGEGKVSQSDLLTDARWRETAVVILQTGGEDASEALILEAESMLEGYVQIEQPEAAGVAREQRGVKFKGDGMGFRWPSFFLHMALIVQSGINRRENAAHSSLRKRIGVVLRDAVAGGDLLDWRQGLEVAGAADDATCELIIDAALGKESAWLDDAVFLQAERLQPSAKLLTWIRLAILDRAKRGVRQIGGTPLRVFSERLPKWTNIAEVALWAPVFAVLDGFAWAISGALMAMDRYRDIGVVVASFSLMFLLNILWSKLRKYTFEAAYTLATSYIIIAISGLMLGVVGSGGQFNFEISHIVWNIMQNPAKIFLVYGLFIWPSLEALADSQKFLRARYWILAPVAIIFEGVLLFASINVVWKLIGILVDKIKALEFWRLSLREKLKILTTAILAMILVGIIVGVVIGLFVMLAWLGEIGRLDEAGLIALGLTVVAFGIITWRDAMVIVRLRSLLEEPDEEKIVNTMKEFSTLFASRVAFRRFYSMRNPTRKLHSTSMRKLAQFIENGRVENRNRNRVARILTLVGDKMIEKSFMEEIYIAVKVRLEEEAVAKR